MINISHISKAEALRRLYNAAKPQGLGFRHFDPKPMSLEEAEQLLRANAGGYFDYLKGRVMKVSVTGTDIEERLYDRDNGPGAALRALHPPKGAN
jgi:hypothetical protein